MEGGGKSAFDAKEATEQKPEFWSENWPAVTDNRVLEALLLYYHINNDFRMTRNINSDLYQLIVDHLCKPIDDH